MHTGRSMQEISCEKPCAYLLDHTEIGDRADRPCGNYVDVFHRFVAFRLEALPRRGRHGRALSRLKCSP